MILPDYIHNSARAFPHKPVIIFHDQKITFQELENKILSCAEGLSKLGIKKGDTWSVLLRNCPEFVILSMALSKLGAILVPINFLEKPDRIALILNDAQSIGILTSKEFYRHVVTASKKIPALKHFYLRDGEHKEFKSFEELLSSTPYVNPDQAGENDLMMLLYTSGTTGQPKGVMLTHKNFIANVDQCLAGIRLYSKDRFLCLLPLFHSFSWTTCMLIPLKIGATIIIIESLLPFDPVIKSIWKNKATLFVAVPQIYSALTSKIKGFKAFVLRFLNPVRICISGAAPLPAQIHINFEKTFGIPLLEGYGLTEAAPVVAMNPEIKRKVNSVGKPLPGVIIDLRDDDGKSVPQGSVGEIWVKGDNVMKGYYHKPEETAESLTKEGWLITGDMGVLDDEGYLSIVDRKKDLIIVKGLNVYPQEVESVIAMHESVKEVAVVGKLDKETGEEIIRAFLTLKEGQTFDKPGLYALCREKLAAYKMPKDFIVIPDMPKNALQKILKKDLRQRD